MTRIPRARWFAMAALAGLLAACGGGSDPNSASLRLLNASVGYDSLDLFIDGDRKLAAVSTNAVSSGLTLDASTYTVSLRSAGGSTTLSSASRTLSSSTDYTLVAYGSSGSLKTALLTDDEDAPGSSEAKLRVLQAAPEAGSVDIYLSDSCATVTDFNGASTLATSVSGGSTSSYVTTGSGTLCVRVTGAGDTSDLRLAVPALSLGSKDVVTLVLTPGASGALVNALAVKQGGAVTPYANGYARVRLAAAVASSGKVGATVGSTTLSAGTTSPNVISYALVPAGTPALSVTVNGTAVASSSLSAAAGGDYTLLVTGSVAAPQVAVLTDDNRLPTSTTNAKVRLVHGSADHAAGTMTLTVNASILADSVAYATASSYGIVTAGTDLAVQVTSPDASSALYDNSAVTLSAQGVYTLFMLTNGSTPRAVLLKDR